MVSLLLTSLLAFPAAADSSDAFSAALHVRARRATVLIRNLTDSSRSTGAIVGVDRRSGYAYIVGCMHGLDGVEPLTSGQVTVDLFSARTAATNPTERCSDVELVAGNRTADVSVLRFRPSSPGDIAVIPLCPPSLRLDPGMPVMTVGAADNGYPTFRYGAVVSTSATEPRTTISTEAARGRSGGPTIDDRGFLVGCTVLFGKQPGESIVASRDALLDVCDTAGLSWLYSEPRQLAGKDFAFGVLKLLLLRLLIHFTRLHQRSQSSCTLVTRTVSLGYASGSPSNPSSR